MSDRSRWLRGLELAAIFVGLPVAVGLSPARVPKIPALLALTLACAALLLRDRSWDRGELRLDRAELPEIRRIVVRFLLLAPTILLTAVVLLDREELFAFPRQRPGIYLLVVLLYPWLSALPQELVWRSYLHHRYRGLLGAGLVRDLASALLFAFLHVAYANPIAPLLSLPGGWIFARTFARTRSLALVAFEHSLYGLWLFTVGLGRWFYDGG